MAAVLSFFYPIVPPFLFYAIFRHAPADIKSGQGREKRKMVNTERCPINPGHHIRDYLKVQLRWRYKEKLRERNYTYKKVVSFNKEEISK